MHGFFKSGNRICLHSLDSKVHIKLRPWTEYYIVEQNVLSETTDENNLKKAIYLMSQIRI